MTVFTRVDHASKICNCAQNNGLYNHLILDCKDTAEIVVLSLKLIECENTLQHIAIYDSFSAHVCKKTANTGALRGEGSKSCK